MLSNNITQIRNAVINSQKAKKLAKSIEDGSLQELKSQVDLLNTKVENQELKISGQEEQILLLSKTISKLEDKLDILEQA